VGSKLHISRFLCSVRERAKTIFSLKIIYIIISKLENLFRRKKNEKQKILLEQETKLGLARGK
jgi:hypothetical protein